MDLCKRAFGVTVGVVWGLAILLRTWFILVVGARVEMISKLSTF